MKPERVTELVEETNGFEDLDLSKCEKPIVNTTVVEDFVPMTFDKLLAMNRKLKIAGPWESFISKLLLS